MYTSVAFFLILVRALSTHFGGTCKELDISLYDELKPYSVKISSSNGVNFCFNNFDVCSYYSLMIMS